jgi:hypothetical protein
MLTGDRAFPDVTTTDLLAAVVKTEPDLTRWPEGGVFRGWKSDDSRFGPGYYHPADVLGQRGEPRLGAGWQARPVSVRRGPALLGPTMAEESLWPFTGARAC